MSKPSSAFLRMKTRITGLDVLFRPDESIHYARSAGFFGVIIGAAGTGKSVLSLQLCCAFASAPEVAGQPNRKAIYLSQDDCDTVRGRAVEVFGFLDNKGDVVDSEFELFKPVARLRSRTKKVASLRRREPRLAAVQLPLDAEGQRQRINRLIEFVSSAKRDVGELVICLDNAETIQPEAFRDLLHGSYDGTEPSYYKLLREKFTCYRLNSWWIFEEPREHGDGGQVSTASVAATPQAYAADIAIRLSARELPGSVYRERDIEIIKARHQPYCRGRHAITIYEKDDERARANTSGIVVWPSVATQLSNAREILRRPKATQRSFRLGINAVDELIRQTCPEARSAGYIDTGTVSVLVSDLDSMSTEIAVRFAEQGPANSKAIFFTTAGESKPLNRSRAGGVSPQDKVQIVSLPADYVSEGKLLAEIAQAIQGVERVVFDNLFSLRALFPLIRDERAFIAALFAVLRSNGVAAFVIDPFEVGEGRNPLSESFAAGLADQVFLLRHVEFQSMVRKLFHVLKLNDTQEPQRFWELVHDDATGEIRAEDRLEFYTQGILSGRPEQLEINMSLYADAEDSPLDIYLKTQSQVLAQTFGQSVTIHCCHPAEYASLQNTLTAEGLRAVGDCHVVSIDEIWLQKLVAEDMLEPFDRTYLAASPEEAGYGDKGWVTAGYDIAVKDYISQRLCKLQGAGRAAQKEELVDRFFRKSWVAVPDRNNVGILAYNPNVWSFQVSREGVDETGLGSGTVELGSQATFLEWARKLDWNESVATCDHAGKLPWQDGPSLRWPDIVALQAAYVRWCAGLIQPKGGWMPPSVYREWEDWEQPRKPRETDLRRFLGRQIGKRDRTRERFAAKLPPWGVFTFCMNQRESCVCFLLELLLSIVPKKTLPIDRYGRLRWDLKAESGENAWRETLALLLQLLSPWDIERLSHGWLRSTNDERPCLFSRQWFSSWGALGLREPGLQIRELPPLYKGRAPTPVSGAWYLGILRGSSAVRAGAHLIRHMTSKSSELYKAERGIGLPVRAALYRNSSSRGGPAEVFNTIPYRDEYRALSLLQDNHADKEELAAAVHDSTCPFHRSLIKSYPEISPLLTGLMVAAAREAAKPKYSAWMWTRERDGRTKSGSVSQWAELLGQLEDIVRDAAARYEELVPDPERTAARALLNKFLGDKKTGRLTKTALK